MSNDNVKRVGVEFVADNAPQFVANTNAATKAEQEFTKATVAAASATDAAAQSYSEFIKQSQKVTAASTMAKSMIEDMGMSIEQTGKQLRALTASTEDINDALAPYIRAEKEAAEAAKVAAQAAKAAARAREEEAAATRTPYVVPVTPPPTAENLRAIAIGHARVTEAQRVGRIELKRYGDHWTSLSSSIGASRVGVALFLRELTGMAGANIVAVQALSSFVYATGTLGIALAGVTGVLVTFNEIQRQVAMGFEEEQALVAATATSYDDLYRKRITALTTTPQGFATGLPSFMANLGSAAVQNVVKQYGDFYGAIFLNAWANRLSPYAFEAIFRQRFANFFNAPGEIIGAARGAFATSQAEIATAQYVSAAAAREQVKELEAEIAAMHMAGTTIDAVIPKYYALQKAMIEGGLATGTVTGATITAQAFADSTRFQRIQNATGGGALKGLDFLSARAEELGMKLREITRNTNADIAEENASHSDKMASIAAQGAARRLDIERNFAQQLRDIEENLAQGIADAQQDLAQRIADLELNYAEESGDIARDRAERIEKIAEEDADRRLQIEMAFRDKMRDIQSQYDLSLFDAVLRRDARALIQAAQQKTREERKAEEARARALLDANKSREKDTKEARDALEKQDRDRAQALQRAKDRLTTDYERRLRELQQAAERQRASARQAHDNALADQKEAEVLAEQSERDSHAKRLEAFNKANALRRQALIDGLAAEKDITEEYARAIIASLKNILSEDELSVLFRNLRNAVQGKIEITVTPFSGGGASSVPDYGLTPYAGGGVIPRTMPILAHRGESVLPMGNAGRAWELAASHMGRMGVPMGGRGSGGGRMGGTVQVDIKLNDGMLNARVARTTEGVVATIVTQVERNMARGAYG